MTFNEIVSGKTRLTLYKPLYVPITWDGEYCVARYSALGVIIGEKEESALRKSFQDTFIFLWNDYTRCPLEELDSGAIALREHLLSLAKEDFMVNNKPTSATIARTIVLLLALINQICVSIGKPIIEFSDENVTQVVNGLFTIFASIWAWWKNASFTPAAIAADEVMHAIKRGDTTTGDVVEFFEDKQ